MKETDEEYDKRLFTEGMVKCDKRKNEIKFLGSVSEKSADKFLEHFRYYEAKGSKNLDIVINNKGGDGYAAHRVVVAINNSNIITRSINTGIVYSAAVPIFEACKIRTSLPGKKFRVHQTTYWSKETGLQVKLENMDKTQQKIQKDLEKFELRHLSRRIGTTQKKIKEWEQMEKIWTAEEALKDGLIDSILYDYVIQKTKSPEIIQG